MNISNFWQFWSNSCLIHSSCWFYDHFFAWNHGTQICFLCKTKLCWNIKYLNYYILYMNINNFWAKFLSCSLQLLVLYDHLFAWNHGAQVCFLCEIQKYVEILNNTWMITFYIGILAIFGNLWATFLPHSLHLVTLWLHFLPEILVHSCYGWK